jgi:hypothetical protein
MAKPKRSKKKPAKARKPASKNAEKKAQREDLCVFAFRLTPEERDAIHKAAGPGKASRFARSSWPPHEVIKPVSRRSYGQPKPRHDRSPRTSVGRPPLTGRPSTS